MSDTYPWIVCHPSKGRFVKSRDGKIELKDLAVFIDDKSAAISVSAVAAGSGFRFNLLEIGALAHQHNVLLIVDAAQALGIIDINVNDIQPGFLVCTASKWLMGPTGIGFL